MTFELTINRVGAFAGATPGLGCRDITEVEAIFRRQLDALTTPRSEPHKIYKQAISSIKDVAPRWRGLHIDPERELEATLVRIRQLKVAETGDGEADYTLVGSIPAVKFACKTESSSGSGRDWIVHARASITACALQHDEKSTKIWWTFEGVPSNDNPLERPTAEDVAHFVKATDQMANVGIKPLFCAYRQALEEISKVDLKRFKLQPDRIRIRMTDSRDYNVEALLDAIYYEHILESEIRTSPDRTHAKLGLELFERFASDVTKKKISLADRALEVDAHFDGLKGIYYRVVRGRETIVAGLGHQSGSVLGLEKAVAPEKRRVEYRETSLRATSASRPISARLADQEASTCEYA